MEDNKKSSDGVNIKILGTGCPNCQRLEQNTKEAIDQLKMDVVIEKITEIKEIMSYGIMSTPAIVIGDEVVSYGVVNTVSEIKEFLTK